MDLEKSKVQRFPSVFVVTVLIGAASDLRVISRIMSPVTVELVVFMLQVKRRERGLASLFSSFGSPATLRLKGNRAGLVFVGRLRISRRLLKLVRATLPLQHAGLLSKLS
uniref:Uncharacterized protein n=1 Tax=Sphaerodactylus townsendi TaxID=933632 RepID=A0ACB8G697_9SAUR